MPGDWEQEARREAGRLDQVAKRHKREERHHRLAAQEARRRQAELLARIGIEVKHTGEGDIHGQNRKRGR
jgi:hypothetical protein